MRIALYPGSFDPITLGHADIIHRALENFDQIEIGIAVNIRKVPTFSVEDRFAMIRETFPDEKRVVVSQFTGLLVDYARRRNIQTVIRGLRAVSDFEYEFQMASMNRRLTDEVDFLFLMTSEEHFFVSSSLVREVAANGGDVSRFVPPIVARKLTERFASS